MKQKHFTIVMPEQCPQCDARATVRLQQVIQGAAVHLSWVCGECEAEWNIDAGEPQFVERRFNAPDRRAKPRTDRRRHRTSGLAVDGSAGDADRMKRPKRPRDTNPLASFFVDRAVGEADKPYPNDSKTASAALDARRGSVKIKTPVSRRRR